MKIYLRLLQKSNHDSFDYKYHPNQILVISDMVPIWAGSWLPESCGHVERSLDSLKEWFEQAKRSGSPTQCVPLLRHHAGSCSIKRAPGSIHQDQKTTCAGSEVDSIALSCVNNAFAQSNHPESAEDAARAIFDNLCVTPTTTNKRSLNFQFPFLLTMTVQCEHRMLLRFFSTWNS